MSSNQARLSFLFGTLWTAGEVVVFDSFDDAAYAGIHGGFCVVFNELDVAVQEKYV